MIKTYNDIVSEELNEFFLDSENSKKKLRLIPKFKSKLGNLSVKTEFTVNSIEKKFKPSVKVMNRNKDKGIF